MDIYCPSQPTSKHHPAESIWTEYAELYIHFNTFLFQSLIVEWPTMVMVRTHWSRDGGFCNLKSLLYLRKHGHGQRHKQDEKWNSQIFPERPTGPPGRWDLGSSFNFLYTKFLECEGLYNISQLRQVKEIAHTYKI